MALMRLDNGESGQLVTPLTTQFLRYVQGPGYNEATYQPDYNSYLIGAGIPGVVHGFTNLENLSLATAKLGYYFTNRYGDNYYGTLNWQSGASSVFLSGAITDFQSGSICYISNGGELRVNSGGVMNVNSGGVININNGGYLDIEASGQMRVRSSGAIVINNGGALTAQNGALVRFEMASGTQPFYVASTTKVDRLNADYLDGFDTYNGTAPTAAGRILVTQANGWLYTPNSAPTQNYHVANKKYVDDSATHQVMGAVCLSTVGAGTWTVPAGCYRIRVVCVGGGGGGSRGISDGGNQRGCGGGGHTWAQFHPPWTYLTVTPGQVWNYYVGDGGAGGIHGGAPGTENGQSGETTWFDLSGTPPYSVSNAGAGGGPCSVGFVPTPAGGNGGVGVISGDIGGYTRNLSMNYTRNTWYSPGPPVTSGDVVLTLTPSCNGVTGGKPFSTWPWPTGESTSVWTWEYDRESDFRRGPGMGGTGIIYNIGTLVYGDTGSDVVGGGGSNAYSGAYGGYGLGAGGGSGGGDVSGDGLSAAPGGKGARGGIIIEYLRT